jgi:hypothetical protein
MIETEPRCIRADRCAEAQMVDGVKVGAAVHTEAGLCLGCTAHVKRAIESLPEDYVSLTLSLGKGDSTSGELVSSSRELPVPVRLEVEALQRELVDEVEVWAEAVAGALGTPWDTQASRDSRAGRVLALGCALLADRMSVLLALRDFEHLAWVPGRALEQSVKCVGGHWTAEGGICTEDHWKPVWQDGYREPVTRGGVDGALRLLELHHRVRKLVGIDRLVRRLREKCPHCLVPALTHADGADVVDCRQCGVRLTWGEYRRRTDPLAALEDVS